MSTWLELKDNPRLKKIYAVRCQIIRLIREWFWSQNFMEVATPLAVRYPGVEPHLNPMPVMLHEPNGAAHNFYLHTSPEYSLKKLLAAGFGKIFELAKTFRDYENFGGHHNPEFTLLEWYRAPGAPRDFMDDAESLFKFVGAALGLDTLTRQDVKITLQDNWERRSMKELWQKYAGLDLDENLEIKKLKNSVVAKGYAVADTDSYDDLFFKIFLNIIEPRLGIERPLWVYDYPLSMCSLSRPSVDPRYGERVELYIAGLELANGFGELMDAAEQARRLEQDRALRQKLGKPIWPVDPDFIAALASLSAGSAGEAKAGGIALGVDRMVLLFTGAKDINEVIFNSAADQLAG